MACSSVDAMLAVLLSCSPLGCSTLGRSRASVLDIGARCGPLVAETSAPD
jgi:hypothetical protein